MDDVLFVEHMALIEVSTSEACRPTAYRPDGDSKVWVCQASHEQATNHARESCGSQVGSKLCQDQIS